MLPDWIQPPTCPSVSHCDHLWTARRASTHNRFFESDVHTRIIDGPIPDAESKTSFTISPATLLQCFQTGFNPQPVLLSRTVTTCGQPAVRVHTIDSSNLMCILASLMDPSRMPNPKRLSPFPPLRSSNASRLDSTPNLSFGLAL